MARHPRGTATILDFGSSAMLFGNMLANDKQSHTLTTLRDTLLPKLISGELRPPAATLETLVAQAGVPDAEKLLEEAL